MNHMPQRTSFRSQVQLAWDSTSLSTFMKCPTKYAFSIIFGFRPKSSSIDLTFGSIVHRGLELFHKSRQAGHPHHEAQEYTVARILQEYSGWRTDHTGKNLWNALRSIIWHTEAFPTETILRLGDTPAIELPFKYEMFEIEGHSIFYCGHIDKIIVDDNDSAWVVDYKTTKSALGNDYFDGYSPSTQLPGYLVASEIVFDIPVSGVLVDAIQVGVNFSRYARGPIILSDAQRDEWMKDSQYYIRSAYSIFSNNPEMDMNKVPRNTEACFGCHFRRVCSAPPSLRQGYLETHFERKFWDPLKRKEAE